MKALLQVALLFGVLWLCFGRLGVRRFWLVATIVAIPLRTTYEFFPTEVLGWVNGISVSVADVCLLLVALTSLGGGSPPPESAPRMSRPILALIGASMLSALNSAWFRMTAFQIVFLIWSMVLYYVVLRRALRTREDLEAVAAGLGASLLLQGLFGCLQFVSGHNFLLFSTGSAQGETVWVGGDEEGGSFFRVFGTIGKPNGYGAFVALLFLLNLVLSRLDLGWRWLRRAALVFGGLGLVFSFSRGAWLSTVVALGAYGFLIAKWEGLQVRKLLRFGAVALVLLLPVLPFVTERLTANDQNAALSRLPLISIAWNIIKTYPLIGLGTNTYKSEMNRFVPADYPQAYIDQVHNFYLLVWAEAGLIGLCALLWLLARLGRNAYARAMQDDNPLVRGVGGCVLVALLQILVYSMTDMYHGRVNISCLFLLCALVDFALRMEPDPEAPAAGSA